jgi:hypothetical protein
MTNRSGRHLRQICLMGLRSLLGPTLPVSCLLTDPLSGAPLGSISGVILGNPALNQVAMVTASSFEQDIRGIVRSWAVVSAHVMHQ